MKKIVWDDDRIASTPVTLYMEYILLRYDLLLKNKLTNVDLTNGEFTYIFNIFYNKPMSQRELSELLFVSEANVTKMLKKLEDKEYIERILDESNKSRKLIYLTEKGRTIALTLLKSTIEWEKELMADFDDEKLDSFKHDLYNMAQRSLDI